ncbi:MAG: RNA-binding protein [Caulobacteraceae bacterium]|nr:RNA-binding protein [Caulobacteraceae bacterium]
MSNPKAVIDAQRERRDLVTGEVMDEARLLRFVASPDGVVTPDIGRKLPGRGLWVAADRASVAQAATRNLFSRAAKAKLAAPADLADLVERLLAARAVALLGLAKREGVLISGFEKANAALRAGKAGWLIEASDGSPDGRGKLMAVAARQSPPVPVCGAFSADELGLALGLENVIHVCLLAGRQAGRFTHAVERLAGFRPLLPESWREETSDGRGG